MLVEISAVDNSSKINPALIGAVIVILILAGAGFWYWRSKKAVPGVSAPAGVLKQEEVGGGLGANIFEKSQNPISDKLSETNPFGADINPFEKQANPLKAQYKNPFE